MARIRSIKPEFPQSESMGRVSRDARLLFLQLWTISDDEGRTRADSRMLASLLYPYDDGEDGHAKTSRREIDSWLDELEREACLIRYQADGNTYLQICNWLKHQKIDKPTKSKIPSFDDSSRILANPRESSAADMEGKGYGKEEDKDQENPASPDATASLPADRIFGEGLRFLIAKGVKERGARSFLGAMRKELDDLIVLELLLKAESEDICDPVPWLQAAGRARKTTGKSRGSPRQQELEAKNESVAREWAARQDLGGDDDANI